MGIFDESTSLLFRHSMEDAYKFILIPLSPSKLDFALYSPFDTPHTSHTISIKIEMAGAITISGLPGSGTSTVADLLHKKLGFKYVNVGNLFRELADKYKMSLQDFEEYCENNSEIDIELDRKQENILKKGDVILEGRLSGWIAHIKKIPSIKIWFDCNEDERVKRIINREGGDFFEKKKEMWERQESEKRRYLKFYGIDLDDKSIYDIIIDTTYMKPEDIVEKIMNELQK